MGPDEYIDAIAALGLTQSAAATFVGAHEVTGRRWAATGPPPAVAKLFTLMLRLHFSPEYVNRIIGDHSP